MGIEYRIACDLPAGFDPGRLQQRLPNSGSGAHCYDYSIESYGFYFVDHLVDRSVASIALRVLLDEALRGNDTVEVSEP